MLYWEITAQKAFQTRMDSLIAWEGYTMVYIKALDSPPKNTSTVSDFWTPHCRYPALGPICPPSVAPNRRWVKTYCYVSRPCVLPGTFPAYFMMMMLLMIPYEDILDVITYFDVLFRGGGRFSSPIKKSYILLPVSTYCSERVADLNPSWLYLTCYYLFQHIAQKGWRVMKIKLILSPQSTYCSEGVAYVNSSWR